MDGVMEKRQGEALELVEEIRVLRPRIEKLIGTGNACLESGIALEPECFWPYAGYMDGNFYADHMSHQVGFVKEVNERDGIKYLGISGGSVYGPHDLRTDGIEVFGMDESNGARIEANVRDMERFLGLFEMFEDEFYQYVDKTVARQQLDADGLSAIVEDACAKAGGRELGEALVEMEMG